MTDHETIEYLKKSGFAVRVEHYRNFYGEPARYYRGSNGHFILPDTKGGMTRVVLEKAGGQFEGVAFCSLKDNYCYKEGVSIALERALKNYVEFLDFASNLSNRE